MFHQLAWRDKGIDLQSTEGKGGFEFDAETGKNGAGSVGVRVSE